MATNRSPHLHIVPCEFQCLNEELANQSNRHFLGKGSPQESLPSFSSATPIEQQFTKLHEVTSISKWHPIETDIETCWVIGK